MCWCRIPLVFLVALVATAPASAQLFGKRPTPKGPPAQRVPELLVILKTDMDERKRTAAAEELQHFGTKDFPELLPTLVAALETDPKTGVRLEIVHTLGKLRPVSAMAGKALEKAAANDSTIRVRLQARTTLMWYHLAGYNSNKAEEGTPTVKNNQQPVIIKENGKNPGVTTNVKEYRPLPVGPVAESQPQEPMPPLNPQLPNQPQLSPPSLMPPNPMPVLLPQR